MLLALLLGLASTAHAALPNPLASDKEHKVSSAELQRSLDQVISTLESEPQRTDLLKKLKQLRDVSQVNKEHDAGVLGLIGSTLSGLEHQFRGEQSPLARWNRQLAAAQQELLARLPPLIEWPGMLFNFFVVLMLWSALALGLGWLARRMRQRFGLAAELPQHPATRDLLMFALAKVGPWLVACLFTLYRSVVLPSSQSKTLAMTMAYVLVVGTVFSALCVIGFSLLGGPYRTVALRILRRRAFRPLWLIGSLAALGEAALDPRLMAALGENLAACTSTLANVSAALLTGFFVLQFRRPIAHLLRNQPLAKRVKARGLQDLRQLVGSLWFLPVLLLVGSSLLATFVSAGDNSHALRSALLSAMLVVVAMACIGMLQRKATRLAQAARRGAPFMAQLQRFFFTLMHIFLVLLFVELGLRIWGLSLVRGISSEDAVISRHLISFGTTLLFAWLVWILADTAVQHMLGIGRGKANPRALTMLPLIRNVLMVTIGVIALIVALANMGMNVTPLLAGAGVIGLAIGFGAQTLVADLITGLFIIIEDSLAIDDYVDVGGHLGTVEALTIRTVRLRDLDGVVHTVPFSEIKSIKNYSRQFGYAMFRWSVPASMPIDDALQLVRSVAKELRGSSESSRNIWSPLEIQGVESFDNGLAILRFRFKTAPIKQWEVQRAFNLLLRRRLDAAGMEVSMPRLNVQLSRGNRAKAAPVDAGCD
jgi:small-conductance mechanosensitive channel